jgi:hypothetical protein
MDDNQTKPKRTSPFSAVCMSGSSRPLPTSSACSPSRARTRPRPPACSSNSWKPATCGQPEGPRRRARSRPDQGRQPQRAERRLLDAGRPRRPLPRDHDARRHRQLLQIDGRRDGHAGSATRQAQPEMALHIREGADALAKGFGRLATDPAGAGVDANAARKAERTVEKAYRRAIVELFQGDDYLNMFKRRETYRHLSNAADRVADAARALNNIVVKNRPAGGPVRAIAVQFALRASSVCPPPAHRAALHGSVRWPQPDR